MNERDRARLLLAIIASSLALSEGLRRLSSEIHAASEAFRRFTRAAVKARDEARKRAGLPPMPS